MYSCMLMEVMMVNKYCKCISYISNGFEKKGGWYEKLNQNSKWEKDHNFLQKHGQSYVLLSFDGGYDGE